MDAVTESMAAYLRTKGYVVIPRERHVILTASYAFPRVELEHSRASCDAIVERAKESMTRSIARQLIDKNLVVSKVRDLNDPVTGHEYVVSVGAAAIKPKT